MTAVNELRSINRLALEFQVDPAILRRAARANDIAPEIVIDGRAYYSIEAAAKIRTAMGNAKSARQPANAV